MLLILISLTAFAQSPNLLKNGSFAEGLTHWSAIDKIGVSVETKATSEGSNELKLISLKEHYVGNYSLYGDVIKPDTN